eukprot:PITA_21522
MGSSSKANAVQVLINQEQPDLLLIQETKISEQDFQNYIKKYKSYTGTSISTVGASAGIGTLWNKNKWDLNNQNSFNWWVRTYLKNKFSKEEYTIYNIYVPNHYRDKALCWDSITSDLQLAQDRNIFLGGDLNLIRNANEKLGGNFFVDPSRDSLETLIQARNLIDIPPHNGKFTWSNERIGIHNIKERLDRILVHERIVVGFPSIKSKIIQASTSDHKPVVLTLDKGRNLGPLPSKYNKSWDSKEYFCKLVQDQWAKEVVGSPHYIWETKLKSLITAIKHSVVVQENEKYRELYRQNRVEEEEQRQKSRCLWLRAGDKSTSFFQNNFKLRRAGNQIDKILAEGKEINDQEGIKEAAPRHFQSLLSADPQSSDNTDFLRPIESKIFVLQNRELDQVVSEEEIRLVAFSMQQDKAPGLDGFTVAFYRNHWDTIKKGYVRMVKYVFQKHKMGENTKSSHLALIPKDLNPLSFDRFQPISLCNVSYKIVTKILANRLKNLLPYLISENQGGFVPHRQITDNVILIQEAIHSSINRKERGMIIKLDMANAYDRVDHQFLTEVLRKFGISNNFISIIMECISHPWTAP